jgi:hypothetical protein
MRKSLILLVICASLTACADRERLNCPRTKNQDVLNQRKALFCQYFGAFACPEKPPAKVGTQALKVINDAVCFIPCGELKLPIHEASPTNIHQDSLSDY